MISERIRFSELQEKTTPIITVENESTIKLDEEKFNLAFSEYVSRKLLVIGVIGKMKTGKSSSLNNFYCILTGRTTRPFDELDVSQTLTKGIHLFHIPFGILTEHYKTKILDTYEEQVDVVLLDCEGTESASHTQSTSKLYLVNMLINSVIHIHVQKRIDKNFAAKFSQALISTNQLFCIDNENENRDQINLSEILPSLFVLIKDADQEWWENTRREKPNITQYEHFLNSYENLRNSFSQFPQRKVEIVDPPENDDESVQVDNQRSNYWIKLKQILEESLTTRKLKTKNELMDYMKKLIRVINQNNIMSVRTEVEGLYQNMFENEQNKLFKSIITNSIANFSNMVNFSPEEIKKYLNNIALREVATFLRSIDNLSCCHIFQNIDSKINDNLNKLLPQLESLFQIVKAEHVIEREKSKIIENIYDEKEILIHENHIKKYHREFKIFCKNCGNDPNSKGCGLTNTVKYDGGNLIINIISLGLFGNSRPSYDYSFYHIGPIGSFCIRCGGDENSRECDSQIISDVKKKTEKILSGFSLKYKIDDWKNSNFEQHALNFLKNYLSSLNN
jgi:hypothetical protein